jgi:hypothetical protein
MLTSIIIAAVVSTKTFTKITPQGEIRVTIIKECDRNGCSSSYSEEPVKAEKEAPYGDVPEDFVIPQEDRK